MQKEKVNHYALRKIGRHLVSALVAVSFVAVGTQEVAQAAEGGVPKSSHEVGTKSDNEAIAHKGLTNQKVKPSSADKKISADKAAVENKKEDPKEQAAPAKPQKQEVASPAKVRARRSVGETRDGEKKADFQIAQYVKSTVTGKDASGKETTDEKQVASYEGTVTMDVPVAKLMEPFTKYMVMGYPHGKDGYREIAYIDYSLNLPKNINWGDVTVKSDSALIPQSTIGQEKKENQLRLKLKLADVDWQGQKTNYDADVQKNYPKVTITAKYSAKKEILEQLKAKNENDKLQCEGEFSFYTRKNDALFSRNLNTFRTDMLLVDVTDPNIRDILNPYGSLYNDKIDLFGDIQGNKDTQHEKIYELKVEDDLNLTATLNVSPVQSSMKILEAGMSDEGLNSIKVSDLNFFMTATFDLPEVMDFTQNGKKKETLTKDDVTLDGTNGNFVITNVKTQGRKVTVTMELANQHQKGYYENYTTLSKAVQGAGETFTMTLKTPVRLNSQAKHGQNYIIKGTVGGEFSANALFITNPTNKLIGTIQPFKFAFNGRQSNDGRDSTIKKLDSTVIQFTVGVPYEVTYEFQSSTKDKELPQDFQTKVKVPDKGYALAGADYTPTATTLNPVETEDGKWTFEGKWKQGDKEVTELKNVSSDMTLTGYWKFTEKKKFKITYKYESETEGKQLPKDMPKLPDTFEVKEGDKLTKVAGYPTGVVKTDEGTWTFDTDKGWEANNKKVDANTEVSGAMTLTGYWKFTEKKKFKITYKYESETKGKQLPKDMPKLPDTFEVKEGDKLTKVAGYPTGVVKTDEGTWTFDTDKGWEANNKKVDANTEVSGAMTLTGYWKFTKKIEPTPTPQPQPTPPTPTPTPQPQPQPTPTPTPQPQPQPEPTPTPNPQPQPTPIPSPVPTPAPESKVTPQPEPQAQPDRPQPKKPESPAPKKEKDQPSSPAEKPSKKAPAKKEAVAGPEKKALPKTGTEASLILPSLGLLLASAGYVFKRPKK